MLVLEENLDKVVSLGRTPCPTAPKDLSADPDTKIFTVD